MTAFVALLRGINLGKRQLRMEDLRRIAAGLGLGSPSTYIASGNLLFTSHKGEAALKAELEAQLAGHMGVPVAVIIRTAKDMAEVAEANPFATEPANKVVSIFLDEPPPSDAADHSKNAADEKIETGKREIYVHYPEGQGRSRLAIPAAARGTARNMNTVAKLAELAKELE